MNVPCYYCYISSFTSKSLSTEWSPGISIEHCKKLTFEVTVAAAVSDTKI